MRNLWIASGLVLALLSLAVALRPVPLGNPSTATTESSAPRPLAAEDLSQIMELRAQFGSPIDRLGGAEANQAAFEQQLRQVAGLDERPSADTTAAPHSLLYRAAAKLDGLADQSEEAGRYNDADRLRSLADQVRQLARAAADLPVESTDAPIPGDSLIDKGRASQAQ